MIKQKPDGKEEKNYEGKMFSSIKNDTIEVAKQTLLYGIIAWVTAVVIDLGIEIYSWFKNNK